MHHRLVLLAATVDKPALDYETKSTYTVTITVSDGSLTDTITVTINITDVVETQAATGVCEVGYSRARRELYLSRHRCYLLCAC